MIKLAFSDKYIYPLPPGHRFPIEKYELVKEQLLHQGLITSNQLHDPGLVSEKLILSVHTTGYWEALKSGTLSAKIVRKIGLPVNDLSVKRARNSVAGTVYSSEQALSLGLGLNLSGGTHHSYEDYGEGFCVLNDIAIACRYVQRISEVSKIAIIDLDVHQGNGTAKIFENDSSVFTFSMHGAANYPLYKEKSDLDIELPVDVEDDEYLSKLEIALEYIYSQFNPEFVFYQSGVDVLAGDRLGKMALTKEGLKMRDRLVISKAHAASIPLVITMGGGYHEKLSTLVNAHCSTFKEALNQYA